jgi:hypothetical protein
MAGTGRSVPHSQQRIPMAKWLAMETDTGHGDGEELRRHPLKSNGFVPLTAAFRHTDFQIRLGRIYASRNYEYYIGYFNVFAGFVHSGDGLGNTQIGKGIARSFVPPN